MAQSSVKSTVSAMAGITTATLGWDVAVSYGEAEINKLLEVDFATQTTKQIKVIECQVTGTNEDGDPYTIDYKFELSAPLISFSKTRTTAVCNLAAPIVGGEAKTSRRTRLIKTGVYTLHLNTLELATATGDNSSYTPPDQSFIFPHNSGSDGFVVINLPASESLTVEIQARAGLPNDHYNTFVDAHKADVCLKLKEKLLTKYRNVRYELARAKSDPPPVGMVQLKPRSFRFAVYEPDAPTPSSAKGPTILSLFIQTRDNDNGEKQHLDERWSNQWHTTLRCSPIPTGQTATIIFNKHMIYGMVMGPAIDKQGFSRKLDNTVGNITLTIDTKKSVKHERVRDEKGDGLGGTVTKTVSAIDVTLPELSLKLYDHQIQSDTSETRFLKTWEYRYSFDWSWVYTGIGGSVIKHGTVTAVHKLNHESSAKPLLDDYSVKMECPVKKDMWKVELTGADQSFWDKMCGGTKEVPQWVKDLVVELPEFTLNLGSFNFFLTTNLLLPSRKVIKVDTSEGLKIPGDLYLVGKVLQS